MGPFDDIGPYAETIISTTKSDVADGETDNKPHFGHFVIGLLLLGPSLWVCWLMGLFVWAYIGLLVTVGVIGTSIWACGYYGTNKSVFNRFRYRTTSAQRQRIARRLSDVKKSEKNAL